MDVICFDVSSFRYHHIALEISKFYHAVILQYSLSGTFVHHARAIRCNPLHTCTALLPTEKKLCTERQLPESGSAESRQNISARSEARLSWARGGRGGLGRAWRAGGRASTRRPQRNKDRWRTPIVPCLESLDAVTRLLIGW